LRLHERGIGNITLVDMQPQVPAGEHVFTDASGLPLELQSRGIHVLAGTRVCRISPEEVEVTQGDGAERALPATLAVLATGWEPDTRLLALLRQHLPHVPVELVGTSRAGSRVMDALHDGFFLGRRL